MKRREDDFLIAATRLRIDDEVGDSRVTCGGLVIVAFGCLRVGHLARDRGEEELKTDEAH